MHLMDALAKIRDIADAEIASIKDCPELSIELAEDIKRYEEAIDKVDQFLDLLREV